MILEKLKTIANGLKYVLTFVFVIFIIVKVKYCGTSEQIQSNLLGRATSLLRASDKIRNGNGESSTVVITTMGSVSGRASELRNVPTRSTLQLGDNNVLTFSKYNWSLAPGIQTVVPKGVGLDVRIFRVGDFGFNTGVLYLSDREQLAPSLSIGYNLRRTRLLSNCDLIGVWTTKTWGVGLRFELGEW